MWQRTVFFLCFNVIPLMLAAQVSGVVLEGSGSEPVKGATVFINKTTIAAETNSKGEFSLTGIPAGFAELLIYKKGYTIFRSPLRVVADRVFKLQLKLNTETVPPAKEGERDDLHQIARALLGTDDGSTISIVSPARLFLSDKSASAKALIRGPLTIDNQTSGYRITGYLETGEELLAQLSKKIILKYDTLATSNPVQRAEWKKQRDRFFFGSKRHFLLSLASHHLADQGFTLKSKSGKTISGDSLISQTSAAGYRIVKFDPGTQVTFFVPSVTTTSLKSDLNPRAEVAVNAEGMLLNDASLEITGAMQTEGLLQQLPNNFYPSTTIAQQKANAEVITQLQEKVYLHTDKPYYYPGEVLWFKGYINYRDQSLRDSLSKVLYVELINGRHELILTRLLRIDSGMTRGDMIIPDSLKPGNFQLRAYTNLMRNFDARNFFVKTLPILGPTDKVDPASAAGTEASDEEINLTIDKPTYYTREKISLTLTSVEQLALNVSVSVTDALQVVPVAGDPGIKDHFLFVDEKNPVVPLSLTYPVERGISFTGQYVDDRGKKAASSITVVQGSFENLFTTQTDSQGLFTETGFEFYDSLAFSFQAQNEKAKIHGKVSIVERVPPTIDFTETSIQLKIIPTGVKQRIISELEVPHDVTTLQTVDVKGNRFSRENFAFRRFNAVARTFSGNRLVGADIISNLTSLIPGLQILYLKDPQGVGQIRILSFSTVLSVIPGALQPNEPLIYVNGQYRGGGILGYGPNAITALTNLNAKTVDYFEVVDARSSNPLIALEGGSGLISIYTKPGSSLNYKTWKIPGFYRPRIFNMPLYDVPGANDGNRDYRSTLYWNSTIPVSANGKPKTVYFFASDLPGKYRIVLEGVDSDGMPVRAVKFFDVKEK